MYTAKSIKAYCQNVESAGLRKAAVKIYPTAALGQKEEKKKERGRKA